jgi:hypothetical protein
MEFIFRDFNTAFYILVKLPDVTFINYALPPPPPRPPPPPPFAPVCVRNISDLPKKNIGRMIGLGFLAKERTSHEKGHLLSINDRGSNVDRYTLASIPNTRRTLWRNGIHLHSSFLGWRESEMRKSCRL